MNINKIIYLVILFSINTYSQEIVKFQTDRWVMDYLLKHVLEQPADTQYVEIRNPKNEIRMIYCDRESIVFNDTLKSGNNFYIKITSKEFNLNNRSVSYDSTIVTYDYLNNDTSYAIGKIDGHEAFGMAFFGLPKKEIDVFDIEINGIKIDISTEVTGGLFNPNFCSRDKSVQYIEAYESQDKKNLYIYMAGSDGGGAYMVKWIFNHNSYITKFVTIYESGWFEFLDGQDRIDN